MDKQVSIMKYLSISELISQQIWDCCWGLFCTFGYPYLPVNFTNSLIQVHELQSELDKEKEDAQRKIHKFEEALK